MSARPLLINVAELLRRPGSSRPVDLVVPADGVRIIDAEVPDGAEVTVALTLEALSDGIVVSGHVRAPWTGTCRRCLGPAAGFLDAEVLEVYQVPPVTSDDAFELLGDQVDLAPLVREVLAADLPLAPVCRSGCAGLCPECGANRNDGDCGHHTVPADARWSALDGLRAQLEAERLEHRDN